MKIIIKNKKNQKFIVYIDKCDKYLFELHSWCVNKDRSGRINGLRARIKGKHIYLHSLIKGTIKTVDHIDRNTLNNKKSNLRKCTTAKNSRNLSLYKTKRKKISKFKGVTLNGKKWRARIRVTNKLIHLGYFVTQELAAKAYDKAAIKYFKEFSCTNKSLGLL